MCKRGRLLPLRKEPGHPKIDKPVPTQAGFGLPLSFTPSTTACKMLRLIMLLDFAFQGRIHFPSLQCTLLTSLRPRHPVWLSYFLVSQIKFPLDQVNVIYTGLMDSLCVLSYTNGEVSEIISIGKTINWAADNPDRLRLWRAPLESDLTWKKTTLRDSYPKLIQALQKVESVWDEPGADVQGVVPLNKYTGQPEIRTCEDYNFSSPAFDYLRVFYNETGWEQLFPKPVASGARQIPNVSQCAFGEIPHGTQFVNPPWIIYNRLKNDWMKEFGAISSGFKDGKPVYYEPLLFNGTYLGNNCTFTIKAPLGFTP
jgi:hypothetical protein